VIQHPDIYILQLDADAVLVKDLTPELIIDQLRSHSFAMMEQTAIKGSNNNRQFFLNHFIEHTMVWFGKKTMPPSIDTFRYFNSGVVLSTGVAMVAFLSWCQSMIEQKPAHHRVGQHMIADQDYFQYWLNTLHPGQCNTLPWYWNHCEHWHDSFPQAGALICHFSNFCNGPDTNTAKRMHSLLESGVPAS
jgi:lipopolysaccharide biosynthesis glycosyltransferase